MRLTVLGSGTCVPSGRRNSSGYFVDAGDVSLRLDAGAGTLHALGRYGLPWEDLSHQWISHFHMDHVNELSAFLFTMKYGRSRPREAPLTILGPAGLEDLVRGLASLYQQRIVEQAFPLHFQEVAPGEAIQLSKEVSLRTEKTPHTKESLAVRIERGGQSIGYTGDTAPSGELAAFFSGVDLLVCECSFPERDHKTAHLAADDVSELAQAANVKRLLATHFYFDPDSANLKERLQRSFSGEVLIAEDGLSIPL